MAKLQRLYHIRGSLVIFSLFWVEKLGCLLKQPNGKCCFYDDYFITVTFTAS